MANKTECTENVPLDKVARMVGRYLRHMNATRVTVNKTGNNKYKVCATFPKP
jgi:hypothetical protein